MSDGSDLVVFIMARGGSTRVRLKNIAPIGDRTVLSFTLEDVTDLQREFPAADCVLMTDHDGIAASAQSDAYRPANFRVVRQTPDEAGDFQEWFAVRRVLGEPGTEAWRFVLWLGGDCVSRPPTLLADACRAARELESADIVLQSASAVPVQFHPYRMFTLQTRWECALALIRDLPPMPSQNYPAFHAINGGAVVIRREQFDRPLEEVFRRMHVLISGQTLEIDTPEDLELARARYLRGEL